jgi:hypothetical protein
MRHAVHATPAGVGMGAGPFRGTGSYRAISGIALIVVAALALLQPGFDPVFLATLSAAHGTGLSDHGWVVGATQAGMALGSLVALYAGTHLPRMALPLAALGAIAAALTTAAVPDTAMLLGIRAAYGFAMGMVYTQAMSSAAAARPNGAYGAVFLTQLILAALVAMALPALAAYAGPRAALAGLALIPALALTVILLLSGRTLARTVGPAPATAVPAGATSHSDPAGWALAAATLLFICATMLIWSSTGALALAAHIEGQAIGRAVAIGSIVGAVTALCVMHERPVVPLPVTGLLSALGLLSPIIATTIGGELLFTLSVILLNIGSTAIIVRASGMATARARSPLFRRLVATTHSLGMILGPVMGAMLSSGWGDTGLRWGATGALVGGCAALLLASAANRGKSRGMRPSSLPGIAG